MQKTLLSFVFLFCFITSFAQNFVPNGDLETFTSLPTTYGQINLCSGWNNCSGQGTADYYNTAGTPLNYFGPIPPHSGNGMAGLCTYHGSISGFREYMATQLTQPLTAGLIYKITFYLTTGLNGGYGEATDRFGVALSQLPLIQPGDQNIIVTGQPELTDTICTSVWQQFDLYYTASGSEQYITIGNFKDNSATSHTFCHTGTVTAAYYFIDDISMELATGLSEYNALFNSITISPSPFTSVINVHSPITNKFSISISNTLGQKVFSKMVSNKHETTFDLSSLQNGVYFIELFSGEEKMVKKIMKL